VAAAKGNAASREKRVIAAREGYMRGKSGVLGVGARTRWACPAFRRRWAAIRRKSRREGRSGRVGNAEVGETDESGRRAVKTQPLRQDASATAEDGFSERKRRPCGCGCLPAVGSAKVGNRGLGESWT